jgi:uncharacterized protein
MPEFAAWRFVGGVDGFEVVYPTSGTLRGHTSAVEDALPYAVGYEIQLDQRWHTRRARVWADTLDRTGEIVLASDGDGTWTLDGVPAPHLNGLIDIDLEASACTNTLPIHRMSFPTDQVVPAAAVYVQALDLSVTRLDQTYRRIDAHRFAYTSEADFRAVLEYDGAGLIIDYPGVARRFA